MLSPDEIKIGVLLIVALVYAAFDVFNNRNVPDILVYATVAIGIVVAFLYNYSVIEIDLLIAAIIGVIGFAIYKLGFLGGGDVLELVFVSLVLPIQGLPYYTGMSQLYLPLVPFVISVIIAAGYTALVFMPIYYLLVKRMLAGVRMQRPDRRGVVLGFVMLLAYIAFASVFTYAYGFKPVSVALVVILALASFITLAFEKDIYSGMTTMLYPSQLETGDMLALNLMKKEDIEFFRGKYRGFGRLTTGGALKALKNVKKKVPVYRDSVPFSLFILLGIIISLLFGNIVFILIGI